MIERDGPVPITRQAELLGLSRSAVYYKPVRLSAEELALMAAIDALHLEHPFAGRRMLTSLLRASGHVVGHTHVRTLMKRMGVEALYRKPRTSTPASGHKIFPYLLRHLEIERPNQAWGMDITYVPMPRGFMYLVVVLDWASCSATAPVSGTCSNGRGPCSTGAPQGSPCCWLPSGSL